jgi:hypothetical protein
MVITVAGKQAQGLFRGITGGPPRENWFKRTYWNYNRKNGIEETTSGSIPESFPLARPWKGWYDHN